jgi:SAM-dependent methyltransferase
MRGSQKLAVVIGAFGAAAAVALKRHSHGPRAGRHVPGGELMPDVGAYDFLSGITQGGLFRGISDDVAVQAPPEARVLEVGCGPGHLAIALTKRHAFVVTGLDLDPAMIDRARANADRSIDAGERRPTFVVGDVASLPFDAGAFDVVVSTFSMHHWDDPSAGLAEIGRVLRPGGRALIWDLRPGSAIHLIVARHHDLPDPAEHAAGSSLTLISSTPWRWPLVFKLSQRYGFVRAEDSAA